MTRLRKYFCYIIFQAFLLSSIGAVLPAQSWAAVIGLSSPGQRVAVSPLYQPTVISGIKFFPDNPFRLDFFVDRKDPDLNDAAFKEET